MPVRSTARMKMTANQVKPLAESSDRNGAMETPSPNPYLRDAVMTATPEQLQLMLYDGAIRYALQGKDALTKKDYETAYNKLTRAQHIIIEMINGLNYDVNPDLCKRVASIYNFLYRKLVDACVQRNTDFIDDALRVLRIERETWQILVDKVARARAAGEDPFEPAESAETKAVKSAPRVVDPLELKDQPAGDSEATPVGISIEG